MSFIGTYNLEEVSAGIRNWHVIINANLQKISDKLEARWVPFVFTKTDLPASVSTVAMGIGDSSDFTQVVVPFPGSIVALSAYLNATPASGSVVFDAAYDGTGTGNLPLTLDNTVQYDISTQTEDVDAIVGVHRVGVIYTTASLSPTTLDATVVLWIIADSVT